MENEVKFNFYGILEQKHTTSFLDVIIQLFNLVFN